MGARLANLVSHVLEVLPTPTALWFQPRFSSPVPGSRYRVRRRTAVEAVILKASGYLLELPRRVLHSQCLRG